MIIYKITNIVNKKIYIGLTVKKSAQSRFSKHVSEAKCSNENRYFLNAILKYGRENFKVEEIDFAYNIEELKQKEIHYIKLLNSTDRKIGYNISLGGDGTPGVLKSAETRKKIGDAQRGKTWSKERKEQHSIMLKNSGRDFKSGIENCKAYNLKTSKKIDQYDINLNLIKSFNSITELSKLESVSREGISAYINSNKFENRKTYKGFLYKVQE